uniref:Single-stranded DNA-binding protein n=1 Tax=Kalanchoe fedtschenkoi TaxID=63787 RepID=A0A7N0TST9_KALFE
MASIVRRIATPSPKSPSARLLLSITFSSSPLDSSYSESPFSSLQTDSDNESSLSQTSAAGPENPKPLFKERPLESGLDVGIYKAILVGEIGQNPLQKTLRSGRKVTLISLGTGGIRNNRRPLDNEDPREYANRCSVQWHRVSVYPERLGDTVMKHVKPGTILYVEGNLESKIFNDPITGLVRRIREVAVRRNGRLVFLSSGGDSKNSTQADLRSVGYY